jgi:ribulose bisphosphate carboxylase small subunit
VGIEYVDKQRFQTGSWTYQNFEGNASDAIAALETCLGTIGIPHSFSWN